MTDDGWWVEGWMMDGERMNGWMDGWTMDGGWMGGWTDGEWMT